MRHGKLGSPEWARMLWPSLPVTSGHVSHTDPLGVLHLAPFGQSFIRKLKGDLRKLYGFLRKLIFGNFTVFFGN